MDVRILDLDGSLTAQEAMLQARPVAHGLRGWGPRGSGSKRAFRMDTGKR